MQNGQPVIKRNHHAHMKQDAAANMARDGAGLRIPFYKMVLNLVFALRQFGFAVGNVTKRRYMLAWYVEMLGQHFSHQSPAIILIRSTRTLLVACG